MMKLSVGFLRQTLDGEGRGRGRSTICVGCLAFFSGDLAFGSRCLTIYDARLAFSSSRSTFRLHCLTPSQSSRSRLLSSPRSNKRFS